MNSERVDAPSLLTDDRLWIILSHLSILVGAGLFLPLVVYLWKKEQSPNAAEHAREALNFHISVYIYSLLCLPLCFLLIGIPLLMLVGLAALILAIVAAVRAADGGFYRYPLTIRLVP